MRWHLAWLPKAELMPVALMMRYDDICCAGIDEQLQTGALQQQFVCSLHARVAAVQWHE